ncbi:MAG: hypothetical protein H9872_02660 [Candidatus Cellulosilyticum pullistercoris]|uniref:Uncharacterized protein n=1 Tax=Candidatus Cellulosilyticum pullistercoris TaxID=2838521 RepID=A0A9E2KB03_9FIRM|nr:hypothetical protein [Candidatus Cellulosilyticum pullistercoris]
MDGYGGFERFLLLRLLVIHSSWHKGGGIGYDTNDNYRNNRLSIICYYLLHKQRVSTSHKI